MTPRMARVLISLYPRRWRERYQEEFLHFLQEHPFRILTVLNVIGSALHQRFRAHGHSLSHSKTVFSLYSEGARRAIFFARYEASYAGSRVIEPEHLLLGILREAGKAAGSFLDAGAAQAISESVRAQLFVLKRNLFSGDLPLSQECKRILLNSSREAEQLKHNVGVEHLLLGILREENSKAAEILRQQGVEFNAMREKLLDSSRREPDRQ